MACWAVIPVKTFADGKSRLAEVLPPAEREALARAMFSHVIGAAKAAEGVAQVCLLGTSRQGLDADLPLLADPGGGLNPALQFALEALSAEPVTRMLILFGDLPTVSADEVAMLASGGTNTVLIAPDRHGSGTNALSLPLPAAGAFDFDFGPESFVKHCAEIERLGLNLEVVRSDGLARDVDEPDDLADADELMARQL